MLVGFARPQISPVWCLRELVLRTESVGNVTYELCGNVENGLEGEPPPAEVEEILETWTKKLHYQGVVLPTRAEVVHLRYTLYMCVMNYTDRQKQITPQITPSVCDVIKFVTTENVKRNKSGVTAVDWADITLRRKIHVNNTVLKIRVRIHVMFSD